MGCNGRYLKQYYRVTLETDSKQFFVSSRTESCRQRACGEERSNRPSTSSDRGRRGQRVEGTEGREIHPRAEPNLRGGFFIFHIPLWEKRCWVRNESTVLSRDLENFTFVQHHVRIVTSFASCTWFSLPNTSPLLAFPQLLCKATA
jgi:hypothetical protein